jgi:hypothetical protein
LIKVPGVLMSLLAGDRKTLATLPEVDGDAAAEIAFPALFGRAETALRDNARATDGIRDGLAGHRGCGPRGGGAPGSSLSL